MQVKGHSRKLIKLNAYGTLGLVIPKAICDSLGLSVGDVMGIQIRKTSPIVLKLEKMEPEKEW